jgi:hypothetical protein
MSIAFGGPMVINIEWIEDHIGLIRGGNEPFNFGDQYSFVACVKINGDEAEIKGGLGKLTQQMRYEIKIELKNRGVNTVKWDRILDGKSTFKTFNIQEVENGRGKRNQGN